MTRLCSLPTTVLAGYLGAGKTTLLNALLRQSVNHDYGRLAVMVNDFGDVNIDAALIVEQTDSMITLSNGCICCSIGGALYDAIDALLQSPQRPDHLLIEASGVAEPARVANIARAEPELSLDAIVTLVDLEQFTARLNDQLIADSVTAQVQQADILILTKADITEPELRQKTLTALDSLAPTTPRLEAVSGDVDAGVILGLSHSQSKASDHGVIHDLLYTCWSFQTEVKLTAESLSLFIDTLPKGLLRLKGFVGRSDTTHPSLVQCVGNRICISDASDDLAETPANQTRLIAIALKDQVDFNAIEREYDRVAQTGLHAPGEPDCCGV